MLVNCSLILPLTSSFFQGLKVPLMPLKNFYLNYGSSIFSLNQTSLIGHYHTGDLTICDSLMRKQNQYYMYCYINFY